MIDLEIPLKRRSKAYRFFAMVPGFLSWGSIVLLVILSLWSPLLAGIYVLLFIVTLLVKAVGIAFHTLTGSFRVEKAQKVDWRARLKDLRNPAAAYERQQTRRNKQLGSRQHIENLRLIANATEEYPKPQDVYNAVIIATYNESYQVLQPTLESIVNTKGRAGAAADGSPVDEDCTRSSCLSCCRLPAATAAPTTTTAAARKTKARPRATATDVAGCEGDG